MSTAAKIKTLEIDGSQIEIYANEDGDFFAQVEGRDRVKAPTLKQLERKLRDIKRLNRVKVPITLLKTPSWRSDKQTISFTQGDITGIHASNRALLFKSHDGKSEQLSSYDGQICRRLTEEEIHHTQSLWEAKVAAEAAWEAHEQSLKVDGHALVREAANLPAEEE